MTNLTEQWKKEHSIQENKYYYIKDINNNVYVDYYWGQGWLNTSNEDIKEVLAEVPSYEQWIMTKNLSERAHLEMYKARGEKVRLEKENTKLKELLKKAKEVLEDEGDYMIVQEINQVLADNQIQANTVACNKIQENE